MEIANIMIQIQSDIRLSFEELKISFQSILDNRRDEFKAICKNAVDNFDFEKALTNHINDKINEGLEKAFSGIDLSETLQRQIWNEIEDRMSKCGK